MTFRPIAALEEKRAVIACGSDGTLLLARSMVIRSNGRVGIGTNDPQHLLSVNGVVGAKDVIVTNSGWSDHVFKPGYRLRPLSEVDKFICSAREFLDSKFTIIMQPAGAQGSVREPAAGTGSGAVRSATRGCSDRGIRAARLGALRCLGSAAPKEAAL